MRGQVAILETCGNPSGFGMDFSVPELFVPTDRMSLHGGLYRLCWRDGHELQLHQNDLSSFQVDFGTFVVFGPLLDQHRTCIAGVSCDVTDLLFFGGARNFLPGEVLVLETCGQGGLVGQKPLTLTEFHGHDGSYRSFRGIFERNSFTAGGRYQMCWCSLCEKFTDFHINFGTLTVVGPNLLSQTCTSGQVCQIHASSSKSKDTLVILSTCGAFPEQFTFFHGHLHTNVDTATWSTAITVAGGQYRLCWCSSLASCSQATDFIVDMGELVLLGPSPLEQHRTCISGQSCEFDGFLGNQLSGLNKVLLADTCGVASMPTTGGIASLTVTLGVSAVVRWGVSLQLAGGVYRLCWCSGETGGTSAQSCYDAEDFQTDAGSLTMIGVAPLQQEKTCISGLPCEIDGITGIHTSGTDQFLVLQTCGTSTTVEGFSGLALFDKAGSSGGVVSWGPSQIRAAGGRYDLCWCPDLGGLAGNVSCRALHAIVLFLPCVVVVESFLRINLSNVSSGCRSMLHAIQFARAIAQKQRNCIGYTCVEEVTCHSCLPVAVRKPRP